MRTQLTVRCERRPAVRGLIIPHASGEILKIERITLK